MSKETITLPATPREVGITSKSLRGQRLVPVEFYGAGQENLHLAIDYQTFRRAFEKAGQSTVCDLVVDGGEPKKVLIHDIVFDPITDEFQHADLLAIDMNKAVTAPVSLSFVGTSTAIKSLGCTLRQNRSDLTIKSLPADLPEQIEIDISVLENPNDSIHVRDLQLGEKVEILENEAVTLCMALPPKTAAQVEEELAEPVGEAVSAEDKAIADEEKAAAAAGKDDKGGKGDK